MKRIHHSVFINKDKTAGPNLSLKCNAKLSSVISVMYLRYCINKSLCQQQECVPEDVQLKTKVFKEIDSLVTNDTVILASSTSCIVPSLFVSDCTHREQCIVAHPVSLYKIIHLFIYSPCKIKTCLINYDDHCISR